MNGSGNSIAEDCDNGAELAEEEEEGKIEGLTNIADESFTCCSCNDPICVVFCFLKEVLVLCSLRKKKIRTMKKDQMQKMKRMRMNPCFACLLPCVLLCGCRRR